MAKQIKQVSRAKQKFPDDFAILPYKHQHFHNDEDLAEYSKKNTKASFYAKQAMILMDNNCQNKEMFLSTVKNTKRNKFIKRASEKSSYQQQNGVERHRRVTTQLVEYKQQTTTDQRSSESVQIESKIKQSLKKQQPNGKIQKIRVTSQAKGTKIMLNNYFTKPAQRKRSPIQKQVSGNHLQKILRIRQNIRQKNVAMKFLENHQGDNPKAKYSSSIPNPKNPFQQFAYRIFKKGLQHKQEEDYLQNKICRLQKLMSSQFSHRAKGDLEPITVNLYNQMSGQKIVSAANYAQNAEQNRKSLTRPCLRNYAPKSLNKKKQYSKIYDLMPKHLIL